MPNILYDASNYTTKPLTTDVLDQWVAGSCGGVIVQALDPPPGYPRGQTKDQISRVLDYGLPVIYYPFWWAFAGLDFLKRHMDTLSGFEGRIAAGAIDVEDTTVGVSRSLMRRLTRHPDPRALLPEQQRWRIARQPRPSNRVLRSPVGASPSALIDDIASWVEYMRTFPTTTGMIGWYSGPWYEPYLGSTTWPADHGMFSWIADYDNVMDPNVVKPCFGYSVPVDIKQFAGNVVADGVGGLDMNVATDEFMSRIGAPAPQPGTDYTIDDYKSALGDVTAADGEIVPALQAAAKLTTAKKMRAAVYAVTSRLDDIHKQFLEGSPQ